MTTQRPHCGTPKGWREHKRFLEVPCERCYQAQEADRQKRAAAARRGFWRRRRTTGDS